MKGNWAVRTKGLSKWYGQRAAVAELGLEVRRGEVFGLLGPNGAGKSTTVKMLLGLVRPDAGAGELLGRPVGDVATRARVGFLPEHFQFQDWLSGAELLRLHGRLLGMSADDLGRRIGELLERVGLATQGTKSLRAYSKGMRQRVGLAQALLNAPDIVFLDEPSSGLDPLGRLLVRDLIREQRERGAAVFLNSHLLSEVEVSCDRVAFMRGGQLLATHTLPLAPSPAGMPVRLRARQVNTGLLRTLAVGEVRTPTADDRNVWHFAVREEAVLPGVIRALVEAGAEVYECSAEPVSLEAMFLDIIGSEVGE